ncbi:MAG: glycosyltransferase family 4 protein [Armatimonadota bacterium]
MRAHTQTLAVLTTRYGCISETFIRRHITDICPGHTVVISKKVLDAGWCPATPLLPIGNYSDKPGEYLARVTGRWQHDRRSQALRAFLQEHHVTAVLGEWLNFSALWFECIHDLGIKFIAHAHGYDVSERAFSNLENRLLYRRLNAMDGIVVVSQLTKQRLIQKAGVDPSLIHVVPCCVDIPSALPTRAESDMVRCLCVGRLVEKKGPLFTLAAFREAYRQDSRLRLELIGDGPLNVACQRYCQRHNLQEVVTFHGTQPSAFVAQRLAQADIFLLHSQRASNGDEEGLPVAILEAMAYGLPVISTRHAGIPEAVEEGVTGYLTDERDWHAMGRYLIQLATQPAVRHALGAAGYSRAAERFSAADEIRQLREIIFGKSPAMHDQNIGVQHFSRAPKSALGV